MVVGWGIGVLVQTAGMVFNMHLVLPLGLLSVLFFQSESGSWRKI